MFTCMLHSVFTLDSCGHLAHSPVLPNTVVDIYIYIYVILVCLDLYDQTTKQLIANEMVA